MLMESYENVGNLGYSLHQNTPFSMVLMYYNHLLNVKLPYLNYLLNYDSIARRIVYI